MKNKSLLRTVRVPTNKNLFLPGGPLLDAVNTVLNNWYKGYYDENNKYQLYSSGMANAVKQGTYSIATPEKGGLFNISKADNPFSKMNIGNTGLQALNAVSGPIGNALSGGHESAVGNTMLALSSVAGMIPGPYGAAISAGLNIVGGAVNGLFGGPTVNKELQMKNQQGTDLLANTAGMVSSWDDVLGVASVADVKDVAKNSVFGGGASAINAEEHRKREWAEGYANRLVLNLIDVLNLTTANQLESLYAALGGPISKDSNETNSLIGASKRISISDKTRKTHNDKNISLATLRNIPEDSFDEGDTIEVDDIELFKDNYPDIQYEIID